jgi:hypothetical protein
MDEGSAMTIAVKNVVGVLDNCAALLDEYSKAFGRPDSAERTAVVFADQILGLARDHGLRTIRAMNRLLGDDEGNVALACTLLRPFYELSVRLLWASREVDGWLRLEFYFARESRKWENACKDSGDTRLAKLGSDLLQRREEREVTKWKDGSGNTIKCAPDIYQTLKESEGHDAPKDHTIGKNSGRVIYTTLYRVICRPAHAHIEPLTGTHDTMYLNAAGYGACLAGTALLTALIYHTSQCPGADVEKMLARFMPLLGQIAFGNG